MYRNDAGVFIDIAAELVGVYHSSVAWGDYDNDGDLDILLTGYTDSSSISYVYRNDAGVFTDIAAGLVGVSSGSVAWGDYDNDGDLDILLTGFTGSSYISRVYRNSGGPSNTPPSAPTGLSASPAGDHVTLSWDASSDGQTPAAGLLYNLRVGITLGGSEIMSAMADPESGYRRIVQLGNAQQRTSWTIAVPPAATYYWSVQAVDGAFAGSTFAVEQVVSPSDVLESNAPTRFALRVNFPNPFCQATTIGFELPFRSSVKLEIFDASGSHVRTLTEEERLAGRYRQEWDGRGDGGRPVASGVYYCNITAGDFHSRIRMTRIR